LYIKLSLKIFPTLCSLKLRGVLSSLQWCCPFRACCIHDFAGFKAHLPGVQLPFTPVLLLLHKKVLLNASLLACLHFHVLNLHLLAVGALSFGCMIKLARLRHILMSKCSGFGSKVAGHTHKWGRSYLHTSATSAAAMINLNTFRPINFTRLWRGWTPFGVVMDRMVWDSVDSEGSVGSASCHASASIRITSHSLCSCPFSESRVGVPLA